jgi:anaerobic carbon-monoxide dehydrogenase iron sulfur subunit
MPHVRIRAGRCTGCHLCEYACSAFHEGAYRPSIARLFVEVNPTNAEVKGHACLQTACAKCQEACRYDAIATKLVTIADMSSDEKAGMRGLVLVVDEQKCVNCGECYDACPIGVIREHPDRHVAVKCDLCDGDPQCIGVCQNPHILAVNLQIDKLDRARMEA